MVTLRLFAVLVGFGTAIGLWRIFRAAPGNLKQACLWNALLATLGALIGARAGYVLAHPVYYSLHPEQSLQFWQGGLNAFGALAGALLFMVFTSALLRLRVLQALDRASLLLLPVGTLTWLGFWYEGVAYGRALPSGALFSLPSPDETGLLANRFPLQFAAAVSLLLLLSLIEYLAAHNPPGLRFALIGLGFSAHTLCFSMLRADQVFPIQGIRSDAFLSILSAAFFALIILIILLAAPGKKDKMKREETV